MWPVVNPAIVTELTAECSSGAVSEDAVVEIPGVDADTDDATGMHDADVRYVVDIKTVQVIEAVAELNVIGAILGTVDAEVISARKFPD